MASGCPYPPCGACRGVAGEVVRRRRARAVARTVEEREDDRGEVGRPSLGQLARVGQRPLGGQGLWPLSPFSLLSLLFSFSSNFCLCFEPLLTLQNYATGQNNLKELLGTAKKRL